MRYRNRVTRRRACQRKDKLTQEAAGRQLVQLRRSPDCYSPDTLHAYRCPHCGGWHVGNTRDLPPTAPAGDAAPDGLPAPAPAR